jgi:mRNA interferase HigB
VKYNALGPVVEESMRVISRKKLREAWTLSPELEKPLRAWSKVAEKATWARFSDVRASFRKVDQIDEYFVFNILGNRYRLICLISYEKAKVYVLHVMTHAEYDRGQWKNE